MAAAAAEPSAAAAAWPHFVPRAELDPQLQELRGSLARLTMRLSGLEERASLSEEWIGDLRTKCSDQLATKLELGSMASRLDIDVGICRQELEEGLGCLRAATEAQVAAARAESVTADEELRQALASAAQESDRLEAALGVLRAEGAAADVAKECHSQACDELREGMASASAALQEQLAALREEKASCAQLAEALQATQAAREEARSALEEAARESRDRLRELDRFCHRTYTTQVAHEEVRQGLLVALKQWEDGRAEHSVLRKDFEAEREKLLGDRQHQAGLSTKVDRAFGIIAEVRDAADHFQADFEIRCRQQEQSISNISSSHKHFLDQWKRRADAQEQAHLEVRSTYDTLRRSHDSHVEEQRVEGERLRQHSTQRFIEQLDKAMHLQQSVDRVEQDHAKLVKLTEAQVGTGKLPKL